MKANFRRSGHGVDYAKAPVDAELRNCRVSKPYLYWTSLTENHINTTKHQAIVREQQGLPPNSSFGKIALSALKSIDLT